MGRFLTQAETCELLNISKPTLRKWIKEGTVKAIKKGNVVRIPADQFEKEGSKLIDVL